MHFATFATLAVALAPSAFAHGWIKEWGLKGGNLERAQKTDLKSSAMRAASDNTGWIGSNFADQRGIVCGASQTPGGTVAAPSGTFFADAAQSAGRELAVAAGDTVQLVVAGNAGEGWPHRNGHIQTYLGSCDGDCTNFDASKAQYFKIQEEDKGIQNTLIPAYDGSVDGNRYDVTLPEDLDAGSYIFRFELITYGQSSSVEGGQTQLYPYCGQIKVAGSSNGKRSHLLRRQSFVSFPAAYADADLFDQDKAPGPNVVNAVASTGSSTSSTNTTSSSSKKTSSKASTSSKSNTVSSSSLSLASSAPQCASMCLRVKISEAGSLAASCKSNDAACLCGTDTFVEAFGNCARDNCDGDDAETAISALTAACGSTEKKRDVLAGAQRRSQKSTRSSVRKPTVKRNKMRMHKMRRASVGGDVAVKGFHH